MNKKQICCFMLASLIFTSCSNQTNLPVLLNSNNFKNNVITNSNDVSLKNSISFKLNFKNDKKFQIKYDISEVRSVRVWLVETPKTQSISNGININSLSIPESSFIFNVNNSTANITYKNISPNSSQSYSYRIAIAMYNELNAEGTNITDTTQNNSIKIDNSIDAAISDSGGEENNGYITVSPSYKVSSITDLSINAKIAN